MNQHPKPPEALSFFTYEFTLKKRLTRRETFVGKRHRVGSWTRLQPPIEPLPLTSGRVGHQSKGLSCMLCACGWQQWFGLADEALEDAVRDKVAMRDLLCIDARPSERSVLRRVGKLLDGPLIATRASTNNGIRRDAERVNSVNYTGAAGLEEVAQTRAQGEIRSDVQWHLRERCITMEKKLEGAPQEVFNTIEHAKAQVRSPNEHSFQMAKNLFHQKKDRRESMRKNGGQTGGLFGLASLAIANEALRPARAKGTGAA